MEVYKYLTNAFPFVTIQIVDDLYDWKARGTIGIKLQNQKVCCWSVMSKKIYVYSKDHTDAQRYILDHIRENIVNEVVGSIGCL
jgi:hypothetical protein